MNTPKRIEEIIEELRKDPNSFVSIIERNPGTCPFHQPISQTPLEEWLDNQNVMQMLHISPRTLQTLRSNGTLPFSRIGNKLFYRRADIQRILKDNYTMFKLRSDGNMG
jgi:hypothetical protein